MSEPKSKRLLPVPIVETEHQAESIPPSPAAAPLPRPEIPVASTPHALSIFDAFAHGAEAMADEMAGLVQSGVANATEATTAMFGARTLTDAMDINASFFRKGFDTFLAGSTRLADIGNRLAAEALRPLTVR